MESSSAPVARAAPAGLDPRRWWVLALLCGAFFMVLLDGTITIVALPSIGADLGFSKQGLPWVLSAYALTFGGLLLLGGRAADLLGRRTRAAVHHQVCDQRLARPVHLGSYRVSDMAADSEHRSLRGPRT